MDAFIVSEFVKKSLQSKKKNLEHAAFIVNTPSVPATLNNAPNSINGYSNNRSNSFKSLDLSDKSDNSTFVDKSDNSTFIDNSDNTKITDTTKVADNSDNYKITDNTDNSATAYSTTDNSSNIVVNNIKVTNVKAGGNEEIIVNDDA